MAFTLILSTQNKLKLLKFVTKVNCVSGKRMWSNFWQEIMGIYIYIYNCFAYETSGNLYKWLKRSDQVLLHTLYDLQMIKQRRINNFILIINYAVKYWNNLKIMAHFLLIANVNPLFSLFFLGWIFKAFSFNWCLCMISWFVMSEDEIKHRKKKLKLCINVILINKCTLSKCYVTSK